MSKSDPSLTGIHYEIKISGELDECWSSWFNGVTILSQQSDDIIPETTLKVFVPDQSKLRGILNKIWDLNLTLISVCQYEAEIE